MVALCKYLVADVNNVVVFDKEAIAADNIKDFTFSPEATAEIIKCYDAIIEATNAGTGSVKASCEISDFAIKAKCLLEQ